MSSQQVATAAEVAPAVAAEGASAMTRRRFLKLGLGALGALAALEAGGAAVFYLQSSAAEAELGGVVNVGPAAAFPPASVTEFSDSRFFLVRAADGGFIALYRRCPHLGCTIAWEASDGQFICPCHASSFDIVGNYDSPPVPRPLDTFAVSVRDGNVLVDTGVARQRDDFQTTQLVYA